MSDTILFDREGAVATLCLNNADNHNALGKQELDSLTDYLQAIAADASLRVLIVTGKGEKTFCAGASLKDLSAGLIDGATFQRVTDLLAALNIPTLCALNGSVFGGGAELALSCDFRVGVEGMKMRVPAAAIGLCYPISGIQRFVERLGVTVAKRVLMRAEHFSAKQLQEIGFVDALVPAHLLQQTTLARADELAQLAPLVVRSMKQIIRQAGKGAVDHTMARNLIDLCEQSEDLQEGLAANREKRSPCFRGC